MLRLFSSGSAWEKAFHEAVEFLERADGVLLLGPAIGASGKAWLQDRFLEANPVRFGARIQDWSEWVKGRARSHALGQGKAFRSLNQAAKREHFRVVARALAENGAFHQLQEIWDEEQFFAALLDCIDEARSAGLYETSAIERAKEMLAAGSDPVTRSAYEDFWNLLSQYERALSIQEDERLDEAAILRVAAESTALAPPLFLLGFDRLSLLEVELVQELAKKNEVVLPLALSEHMMKKIVSEKEVQLDHPAALALRGLVTNFPGQFVLENSVSPIAPPRRRFLEAHAPSEEARAAAALGRAAVLDSVEELRYVLPAAYFENGQTARAFREELNLPTNFYPRRSLSHPVARLFFHALAVKEEDYSLAYALELAQLMEFTRGDFGDLASRAARAGVRKGLFDWKKKAAGDRELERFAAFLEKIDRLIPESGTASEFAAAATSLADLLGIAELARRAPTLEFERDAHAALAGVLRNAQMLAASTRTNFNFREWMRELSNLLAVGLVGEVLSLYPRVQFYRYGEWLPPESKNSLTLVLGLSNGVEPRRSFHFYLEEAARRKLSDLLLSTQVQEDLAFLDQLRRISSIQGSVLFSWSRHDGIGKEMEPSWVSSSLDLDSGFWPEIAPELKEIKFQAIEQVQVPSPGIEKFSASLFEVYKECPFKAFAEKILRLEDKVQEASLDVSRLDEGSLVHKALELYYSKFEGKNILDPAERERVLSLCMNEAAQEQRIEYFKGNEALFSTQMHRLRLQLLEFLQSDAENYSRFPFFTKPLCEQKVAGKLGDFDWEGKVDRIDRDEANKKLLVIDYKIGASTPMSKELEELKRFQLQLYIDAAEAANPGFQSVGGLYASISTSKRNQGMVLKSYNSSGSKGPKPGELKYFQFGGSSAALHEEEDFHELRERSRAEALRLAAAIQSGSFPVSPIEEEKSCARCAVRPACRIRDLRAAPREPWPRLDPEKVLELLVGSTQSKAAKASSRQFNPEQSDALERRGKLVFIEASAGTGKTTVIVERIRRFLEERIKVEAAHLAVERFSAISFTEKSAQELAARTAKALISDSQLGPRVAAQAQQQIGTIHGFCRRVLSDFPVEAGVSPMAAMLDQKGADALRQEVAEEFFLFPSEEAKPLLEQVFQEFSRAKIQEILLTLLENRLLFENEIEKFLKGGEGLFPEATASAVLKQLIELSKLLAASYEKLKRDRSVLDFNDLEALALKVLQKEYARDFYRTRYDLLLVDEFQDTNSVQRAILESIARPDWSNLFVVGDAKQSIYRFRAADVSVFQNLRKEAEKKSNLVSLGKNYRSRKEIVEVVNRITRAMFPGAEDQAPSFEAMDAPAAAEREAGGRVDLLEYGEKDQDWAADERRQQEAKIVARLVQELRSRPGKTPSIAILLRKFSGNEVFLRALTRAGISFRVGASRGFYGQSIVTDAIALLRALYGEKNDMALLALLRSPWFALKDADILAIQRRGKAPLFDKIQEVEAPLLFEWKRLCSHSSLALTLERAFHLYPMGRREHLQAVKLLSIIEQMEAEAKPRMEILERLSAWAGWDSENDGSDDSIMPEPREQGTVQVMTIHAAKGLEFDITILADLCSELRSDNSPLRMVRDVGMVLKLESEEKSVAHTEIGRRNKERELAELKRLFYVAVTRAQEELYFVLPRAQTAVEPSKWASCADFLRAADLSGAVNLRNADDLLSSRPEAKSAKTENASVKWNSIPAFPRFIDTSISELAAYQFCGEFHRRKFVQSWDDRIVELWPIPSSSFRKHSAKKAPRDPERERVGKLLKALKIEKKERGIALHRVLERVKHFERDLEFCSLWLLEAYEAQGVDVESEKLKELISFDKMLLEKFLLSDLGRELFADVEAYPEIPFEWNLEKVRLHGAMDRLIKKADGTWVVVDYKSSILEESLDRYRFQVASYMAAVAAHAPGAKVEGYLVDLFEARSYPVTGESEAAKRSVLAEIKNTAANYMVADPSPVARGVQGGEHCFHCPYSLHCDLGVQIVLASK